MTLRSGSHLGPYEILSLLGAGGMGEVYRARDTRLDRIVAIKSLPRAYSSDPERLGRIKREARLLASLNHPNIAAIYGLEEAEGAPHLILEFVDGETLSSRLARGRLAAREAVDIAIQITAAIEAAHERGVIHRDLKPANVMITISGLVKVLDFGLAKGGVNSAETVLTSHTPTSSGTGVVSGTAAYMSPEQARGRPLDRRTDVWSFGCVLYECLAGRRAFSGETIADVMVQVLERDPDWRGLEASAPRGLVELVEDCLQKDAGRRPKDLNEIRPRLAEIARELSTKGSSSDRASDRGSGGTPRPPNEPSHGAVSREPAGAPAPPGPATLAVLYFENLSSDPESDYFCAGMTEDILTDLSKVKGLRVASRTAVAKYRGVAVDLAQAASELGVAAILEGSVRRAGDRVRITAQLINAADGFHLWAERYDRTMQDVFAVQEEIASSIASALRITLTPSESRELLRDRPEDVHAYDLYLKGRAVYAAFTREAFEHARRLFEQAASLDPGYALAWAGIADCWGQVLQHGGAARHEDAIHRGLEAARRSIALDPTLADGHKAEALVLLCSGDLEGSHGALLRAHRANPRHVPTLINLGVDAAVRADLAGAERMMRRAIAVDPHNTFALQWVANLCLSSGRYDETLQLCRATRRLSSLPFILNELHLLRIQVALRRDSLVEAEQAIREAFVDGADPDLMRVLEANIAARQGRTQDAIKLLDGIDQVVEEHGWEEHAASVALMCGQIERAVALLNKPRGLPYLPVQLRTDRELRPLLDRPEFGPRRWDVTLVWPLEAPPIDEITRSLFADVRLESGKPAPEEGERPARS